MGWTGSAARTRAPAVRRDPARGPGRCCGPRSAQQTTSEQEQQGPLADPVTQVGPGLLSGRGRPERGVVRRQTRVKFITARALPDTRMRRRRRSYAWRTFNHLFGVCAARVFPAWCGRGPNHWPPLVPRRRVSRVGAASGRVTGRRPDRNLVVGAAVYIWPPPCNATRDQ